WTDAEHPLAAGWLRANERALARLVEASGRSRYWLPLQEGEALWHQSPPALLPREAAIALSSRAMRTLAAGDVTRSWDDLRAGARLGSLIAQGPLVWEWLQGAQVAAVMNEGIGGFATHATLTPVQARGVLADLQRVPGLPPAPDMLDRVGRVDVLAGVTALVV